ncbi:hypothetical protein Tco_0848987 [Tanacetum coccineum]
MNLAIYDHESWNDPKDLAKPVKAISFPHNVPSTSDRRLIELENQVQRLMEAHLALKPSVQVNKIASSCEFCGGPHDTQICMENPEQAFVDYASSRTDEEGETLKSKEPERALEDEFKDLHLKLPVLEVLAHAPMYNAILNKYVESLKLGKNGSAFIQGEMPMKMKDPGLFTLPCRLGDSKPFATLADLGSCMNLIPLYLFETLNVGILEEKFPRFLGAIPIILKGNMLESEDLIERKIDWKMPPKERDGAWHIRIEIIDPMEKILIELFNQFPQLGNYVRKKGQAISSTWNIFMIPKRVTLSLARRLVILDEESPEAFRIFTWTILGWRFSRFILFLLQY